MALDDILAQVPIDDIAAKLGVSRDEAKAAVEQGGGSSGGGGGIGDLLGGILGGGSSGGGGGIGDLLGGILGGTKK